MQFTQVNIAFLFVLLFLHSTKADLRHCADFEPEIDVNEFSHQNQLEQLWGTFNGTDFEQTEELLQLQQRIETDETNNENYISSSNSVNHVVSLLINK